MICKCLICAQTIIADAFSKRISAINILEDTTISTFPTLFQLTAYISIEKEAEDKNSSSADLIFKFNGEILLKNTIALNFESSKIVKSISSVGVPIVSPGDFVIELLGPDQKMLKKESYSFTTPQKQA